MHRKAAKRAKKGNKATATRRANAARVKVHVAENGASRALKQNADETGKKYAEA
jgi:hypothetical protein